MLGKGTERPCRRVGHVIDAFGFEGPGDWPGSGHSADHAETEAAENQAPDPIRMRESQKRGNARAHGIADDMRTRDAEMIEQAAAVFRHQRRPIVGQLIELLAFSMSPIVERNNPVTGFDEKFDPTGVGPVRLHIRSKTVDEQYRQLVRAAPGIEKRDIHSVAVKMCHCHSH